ncbi:MAG: DNA cytosine methyltransferase, partial [Candidatus Hydrogenedentes bacterium]|nr:DNA cytosine methyltransferase [Candidatus Hydrogenedentota bacterium]
GFPCQPFSVAGKRLGTADARNLWPRMLAVVECIRPTWVVAENVRGLLSWNGGVAFESVCSDLESAGYDVLPLVYPAAGVGTPHLRYRVFVIAHIVRNGWRRESVGQSGSQIPSKFEKSCQQRIDPYSNTKGLEKFNRIEYGETHRDIDAPSIQVVRDSWTSEPCIRGGDHGISNRVDRLRALGNAVVPMQVYPVLKAITEAEEARS